MQNKSVVRCPKCDSTQNYYRVKSADYQCQKCGNQFKLAEKK